MTTQLDIAAIKKQTRLALPEDDGYTFRLGMVLYGFASISSFMAEVSSYLDADVDQTALQAACGGVILTAFRKGVKKAKQSAPAVVPHGRAAADLFQALNTRRSDIVHAYPITSTSDEQILHRRLDERNRHFDVNNEILDAFITKLHDVSTSLYKIRAIVRPDLGD
ncbi:hypothetical protein [Pseudomonas phoenicis]|uniref:hypothetical protein n=1 Tax=unclassified Pseudomonas TaxID=196821 RepID=UPI0039A06730